MRRIISFIVALALTTVGGLVLAPQLFGPRWYGLLVLAGGTMLGHWSYRLWVDVINTASKKDG
jgi:hypothetical protein